MYERRCNFRSLIIYIFFLLLPLFIFTGRVFYLQIIKSEHFNLLADKQHRFYYKIPPQRGRVYDRKMRKLAVSFNVSSCYANPRKIKDKQRAAEKLAAFFDLDYDKILRLLSKDKAFVWIKRHISEEKAKTLDELDIGALGLIKESKRFYPDQVLASHILGFVGVDNDGLEGLELYYNDYLKGAAGLTIISRDARGRHIESKEHLISSPLDGYDLVLTIDKYIQHIAERELEAVYKKYKAKAATIIIMEPSTGEILAMANRPTFNPNLFAKSSFEARRNRAVCDIFEPGSVFKIVTAACALEEGIIAPEDKIYCENGAYKIYRHTLHDHKPYKELTFKEVIKYSSNIGTVKVAQRLKEDVLYQYIKRFGFGKITGIDLPLEEEGIIRPPEQWSKLSISAIPMGQEIAVTALQMLRAVSASANGGRLVRPHLIKRIIDSQNECLKEFKPECGRRIFGEKTSIQLKEILTAVIEEGTGKRAKVKGYTAAGKTGTAQKVSPKGGYSHRKFIAVFAGFLPVENPKIAMIVVVDEPRPVYYGGHVSAPVFSAVAQEVLNYMENNGLN